MTLSIEHGTVIAWRRGKPVILPDHTIHIDGGVIRHVGPSAEPFAAAADEVIDASRHLVVPGLVNAHHHLFQSLTRGFAPVQDAPLFAWLTELYTRWRHLSYDAVRDAAMVSLAELMRSGCTTTSDHMYIYPPATDVRIEAVLEAAESLGVRIHACRGSMSVGRSRGGLPPDDCTEDERRILDDTIRVIDAYHDPTSLAMRRIDLAPCAPFSVSPELLRDTAALGRERGLLLHTHAAETMDEQRYCLERYGVRPMRFLEEHGWLGEDVYLAHCVCLNDDEIARIAETGTGVAHCPCSNMRLGSGIAPVRALLERGARVGVGVDGSSSNDGAHLLAEARQALLLQRVAGGADAMRVADAFRLVTLGGARVLRRDRLGNLDAGCAADVTLFRADDVAFAGAVAQDPLAALILCHAPRADRVIVNGRTIVRDGRIITVDMPTLIERFNRLVAERFRS
jgi:8-oxoguanine deaminase